MRLNFNVPTRKHCLLISAACCLLPAACCLLPAALQDFDDVVENGAERIISAWETEARHRHSMKKRELTLHYIDAIIGNIFALLFLLSAISASVYMAVIWAYVSASSLVAEPS